MATGSSMFTNIIPFESHTSTDVDPSTGDIYIGGYKPIGTTFQVYKTSADTLTTLAPTPLQFPDSTVVFVK